LSVHTALPAAWLLVYAKRWPRESTKL
jgi:hypothetical protein